MAREHYKFIHAYQKTAFYQVPATPSTDVCISFYQWALAGCNGHTVPQTEYNINQVCLRK